jgi:serine-type D-Ala-D-Ala carboxypeptidase/endopeptidase
MRYFFVVLFCTILFACQPAQDATRGSATKPSDPPTLDLAAKIDELSRPLVDADLTVGLVVGVLDGEKRLVRGYGVTARDSKQTPDIDTMFEIGSVSKVFTGLLLADAVQSGKVALDDPVQKYLPAGVVMPKWGDESVLLWHLSTHTSGLPRDPDMNGGDPADPLAHITTERLFAALGEASVRWQPGSKYEYSNLAVGLLGAVLARAQGYESYDALQQRRTTGPLRLKDTWVQRDAARLARMAAPYDADVEPVQMWHLSAMAGSGGISSSMRDMLEFARVQMTPGINPLAAAIAQTQQKHHARDNGEALGLGWDIARDGVTFWKNGHTGGYHAFLAVVPSKGRAVCILANSAQYACDTLARRILQHLDGVAVQPLTIEMPIAVERAVLERYAGNYILGTDTKIEVALRARGLFIQGGGEPPLKLYPRSATEFFCRAGPATITFEVDGPTVKALVLHQGGQNIRCVRDGSGGSK